MSYPFAIEPFSSVRAQVSVWSAAYLLFAACSIAYAWSRKRTPEFQDAERPRAAAPDAPPSLGRLAYWIGCAALGSILLLSATNQLTQNVTPVPLLWIVPLSMYLLSFAICFDGRSGKGWYERRYWITPAMLATGAMAWAQFADGGNLSLYMALPIFTIGVLLGCVFCHGELARSKPNPDYLTHFYLSLATGGAVGGLLVGLAAPQVFNGYWELSLGLTGLAALGVYCTAEEMRRRTGFSWIIDILAASLAAALILLLLGALPPSGPSDWAKIVQGDARWGCSVLLIVSAVMLQRWRLWRSIALAVLLCTVTFGWQFYTHYSGTIIAVRNFYGTLRVTEPKGGEFRRLVHGNITHGSQLMLPQQRKIPTTYYGPSSGIGRTILSEQRTIGSLRIGSVGLGAGTLATYGRPGDLFRVYEINPAVLDIARHQFTYLMDSEAQVEPVLGDARLSLESEIAHGAFDRPEQRFDVLSLDAFSGDSIPVHLLTREAFAVYARVIKPDGVIAFHVSNNLLDLAPIVAGIARDAGYQAVLVADRPPQSRRASSSDWALVTKNTAFLRQPEISAYSKSIVTRPGLPVWTDGFTSLVQILK